MQFTSFDGLHIAYDDDGAGHPVVLLHGLAADRRMFGPLENLREAFAAIGASIGALGVASMPELPDGAKRGLAARLRDIGARVVVPDLRGHGQSDKPHESQAYMRSAIARDVIALAGHLGLEAFDVVGYSLGAIAAAKLLALPHAKLASAVVAGIGKEVIDGETMELPMGHPATRLPGPWTMRAYNDFVANAMESAEDAADSAASPYRLLARAMNNDVAALAAVLRGDGAEQVTATALHGVRIPVLLLDGRNDPASRSVARLLQVLPNAHAFTCEGDHLSTPWQPSFQQAIADFLIEQWKAR